MCVRGDCTNADAEGVAKHAAPLASSGADVKSAGMHDDGPKLEFGSLCTRVLAIDSPVTSGSLAGEGKAPEVACTKEFNDWHEGLGCPEGDVGGVPLVSSGTAAPLIL